MGGFVAGAISSRLYGDSDWHAYRIGKDFVVSDEPFYVWGGNDASTSRKYDPLVRPWYRAAAEIGEGLTPLYADPVTGEAMSSYVRPLIDTSGRFLGCCIAGSFLQTG